MSDFTFPRRLTMEDDIDGFDCGLPVVNNWLRNQLKNAGRQHTAVAYATFSNGVWQASTRLAHTVSITPRRTDG